MSQAFIVDKAGKAEPMERIRCKDEDLELQQLLERNFDLLPGEQMDPDEPRRWLLIKREMPVPDPNSGHDRWSIDFFFVDQDATPTFVECKRCADTRSRREIVGQMLEYAANGHHYWTSARLKEFAEASANTRGTSLETALADLEPTDDLNTDDFFKHVEANLREARLRLVFFLEDSPYELRSVVDYLNKQLQLTEILLVEARQFMAGDNRIVLPTLFGFTEQARLAKQSVTTATSGTRRRWDKESFFAEVSTLTETDAAAVTSIYDTAVALGCELGWGTGRKTGSINIKDPALSQKSFLSVYTNGDLYLNFRWLNDTERAVAVRDRLIALSTERLRITVSGPPYPFYRLLLSQWRGHAAAVTDIVTTLVREFRTG